MATPNSTMVSCRTGPTTTPTSSMVSCRTADLEAPMPPITEHMKMNSRPVASIGIDLDGDGVISIAEARAATGQLTMLRRGFIMLLVLLGVQQVMMFGTVYWATRMASEVHVRNTEMQDDERHSVSTLQRRDRIDGLHYAQVDRRLSAATRRLNETIGNASDAENETSATRTTETSTSTLTTASESSLTISSISATTFSQTSSTTTTKTHTTSTESSSETSTTVDAGSDAAVSDAGGLLNLNESVSSERGFHGNMEISKAYFQRTWEGYMTGKSDWVVPFPDGSVRTVFIQGMSAAYAWGICGACPGGNVQWEASCPAEADLTECSVEYEEVFTSRLRRLGEKVKYEEEEETAMTSPLLARARAKQHDEGSEVQGMERSLGGKHCA